MAAWLSLVLVLSGAFSGCLFRPDLSAYPPCGEDLSCPSGTTCWTDEHICLPDCGEGPCPPETDPDAGETAPEDAGPGMDAGEVADAGDGGHTGEDGGMATPDAGPLRLDAVALPPAVETEAYAHALEPRGGTPPYGFELVGGLLPSDLFLDPDAGRVEGTPAPGVTGPFSFTVRVTDSAASPAQDEAPLSLQVVPLLRIASPAQLPDADSGDPYLEPLHATGGSGQSLIWSVSPGHAPPGNLTLGSNGVLSGSTSSSGTFEVTLTDPGPGGQTRTKSLSVSVVSLGLSLHIRTRALPEARVGEPYDYRLTSGGGTGAHAWTVTSGTLPPGLGLQGDRIRGTPTASGDATVTLQVEDSGLGATSRTFTLTVH